MLEVKGGNKIISLIMISVYSIVLFHSFIPHFHIENEEIEVVHHHHHGHHHHSVEKDNSWIDGIFDFLNQFGHKDIGTNHLDEYVVNDFSNISLKSIKEADKTFTQVKVISNDQLPSQGKVDRIIRPPRLYESFEHSLDPLRGPPSIS